MKIHYFSLLKLLQIVSLLWFILSIAGFTGYDFGVKILFLFWFLLSLLTLIVLLETFKNRKYLKNYALRIFLKSKDNFNEVDKLLEKKNKGGYKRSYLIRWPMVVFTLFFLPIIVYFKKTLFYRYFLLLFVCFWIARDIFFGKSNIEWPILLLTLIMIIMIRHYNIKGETLFLTGILLLAVCPFFLIFHKTEMAERSSIWSYILLCTSAVCLAWASRADKMNGKIS